METLKTILTLKPLTNRILWLACWLGSPKLAKVAIALGADVNSKKKMGLYSDGIGGRHNDCWTGNIYASPIVLAATYALKKNDYPYRRIIKMLAEKGADTSKVVVGTEKTWYTDDDFILGLSPDDVGPYHKTLTEVIKERKSKKYHVFCYNSPADSYPITDSMALYLHKFPKDLLEEKAKFLDEKAARERLYREAYCTPKVPVKDIMSWRRGEELARLAAHKKWLDNQNNR